MLYIPCLIILELFILRSFYIRVKREEPDHYFSLRDVGSQSVVKHYAKYFVFRSFPILIICLLNYKIFPTFGDINEDCVLSLNFILVLAEVLLTNLKGYARYRGIGLAYQHLIFALVLTSIPYFAKLINSEFSNLLPSAQGVLDNIWSGMVIYGVLSVLGAFSKSKNEDNSIDILMFNKDMLMNRISSNKEFIISESKKYHADANLVMAVAIYESIQRPIGFRFLERVFVFIFRKPATQGVMQFMSKKIITDHESVTLSIKEYFQGTAKVNLSDFSMLSNILARYNPSTQYLEDVAKIYFILSGIYERS